MTAREALDALAEFRPHLVLTDLMMPVMGGVELIAHIRADPATMDLPVVAITADATDQANFQARQAGARRCHHEADRSHRPCSIG